MHISKGLLLGGLVAVVGVVWLWSYGCKERVTQPWPPPEPPKDYPVYFMNAVNGTLWTYHPSTRQLDSVGTDYVNNTGVTVSADGKLLYLAFGDRVVVADTDSLGVVTELPYPAHRSTAFSPDNNLLAVMGPDLYILRTSDYSVVYSDTIRVGNGVFSADSRTFYATGVDMDPFANLYQVDPLEAEPSKVSPQFPTGIRQVLPTPDGAKLLLCLVYFFSVLDLSTDSLVFSEGYWPGAGNLGMSVDGRYGFYSNPSTMHFEEGTTDLYVLDVEANQITDTIVVDGFLDSLGASAAYGVGRMVATPDGRWLVAHNAQVPAQLFLFDLTTMSLVDFHEFGNNHWFGGIGVQQMK